MKFSQLMTIASAGILAMSCGSCTTSHGTEKACSGELRADNDDALTVTENGKVAGYVDGNVYVFKGIPYASSPRRQLGRHTQLQILWPDMPAGKENGMAERRDGFRIQLE